MLTRIFFFPFPLLPRIPLAAAPSLTPPAPPATEGTDPEAPLCRAVGTGGLGQGPPRVCAGHQQGQTLPEVPCARLLAEVPTPSLATPHPHGAAAPLTSTAHPHRQPHHLPEMSKQPAPSKARDPQETPQARKPRPPPQALCKDCPLSGGRGQLFNVACSFCSESQGHPPAWGVWNPIRT